MALTLRHWILAAALGCAAIAAAYLPPRGRSEPFPYYSPQNESPEQRREARLASLVERSHMALRLIAWRDSLLRWVRRHPRAPGDAPVLLFDGPITPGAQRKIEEALATAWRGLGTTAPDIVVGVVVLGERRGGRYQLYLLPPSAEGRACLAVIPRRFGTGRGPRTAGQAYWALSGLGPCAFYAAFGYPGPFIERWLLARDFDLAYDASWPLSRTRPADRAGWVGASWRERFWFWNNLYRYPFPTVACAGGRAEGCRAAVFDTAGPLRRSVLPRGMIERRYSWWDRTRGPLEREFYLSDLVRQMGRDRFAQFWRSPLAVDSAFFAAMGTPLGEWTRRWQADLLTNVPIGPAVRPAAAGLGLLFAALILAGGAYFTTRRQVG